MAKSLATVMLCGVVLLLLMVQNQASSSEVPAGAAEETTQFPLYGASQASLRPQECKPRCDTRCSATQYKKPCLFFCNKCCATCLCVPPGTYGNKQSCPCYNNWKTKRGGPKCP